MLRHETAVAAEIARKYQVHLEGMTNLHNAVMSMLLADSWTLGRGGLDDASIHTSMGLLTKACKTFRAIHLLSERGLHEDAMALVRVLLETTAAAAFILQKAPRQRARIYMAYSFGQSIKMLNEWRRTPGLKRRAPKRMLDAAHAALAGLVKQLPPGTNVKGHWSGKPGLQEAMRALRQDSAYSALYRHSSTIAHASDLGAHFSVDPVSGEFVWEIDPRVDGFKAPTYAARELLWHLAKRIDTRLGLGFSATLAPHKLTAADVRAGIR
jgi:hypothetical protein